MKKYLLWLSLTTSLTALGMEDPSEHKRGRDKEKESENQPPRKQHKFSSSEGEEKKQFSPEEKEKATKALIDAVRNLDLPGARLALEQGANINHILIEKDKDGEALSFIKDLLESYGHGEYYVEDEQNPFKALQMVHFLIDQGATIGIEVMEVAAFNAAGVDIILNMVRHGGNFNNEKLFECAITSFQDLGYETDELSTEDYFFLPKDAEQRSSIALWLLLRGVRRTESMPNLNTCAVGGRVDYLRIRYLSGTNHMSLESRLGPLLVALLRDQQDEAKKILTEYTHFGTEPLPNREQTGVNEALIFVAANNNLEILEMILNDFQAILSQANLQEALQAAALRGQADAFRRLVTSGLFGETELRQALEDALMIAAAQQHEDIVTFILNFDNRNSLNLAILPVVQRMEMLAHYQNIEEEKISTYLRLSDTLGSYMYTRSVDRMLAQNIPGDQEGSMPASSSIFSLPPELLVMLFSFLRPPFNIQH